MYIRIVLTVIMFAACGSTALPVSSFAQTSAAVERRFDDWVARFQRRALGAGISQRTLEAAFRGVDYNAEVVALDRKQAEFSRQLWEYLDRAVSASRVRSGRAALRDNRRTLDRIEAAYGVEAEVVAAIWGIESAYGAVRGDVPVIEALATLAFDGRRARFFESQLLAALQILQSGATDAPSMRGSWAGAMGHTQFIPTSYQVFAVDFDGDGHSDIWSDDPTDALASAAAYLKRSGWRRGQPWGVEVRLPRGFDYAMADRRILKAPSEWAAIGIRDTQGGRVPNHGRASILVPAGAGGAAFMIFDNFAVLERYNKADAYVIAVGHLSDRIGGGPAMASDWPRGDRALTRDEKAELQRRLTRAGFSTGGIDAVIGPRTINAVRDYQRSKGLIPDGYSSLRLLEDLRG